MGEVVELYRRRADLKIEGGMVVSTLGVRPTESVSKTIQRLRSALRGLENDSDTE